MAENGRKKNSLADKLAAHDAQLQRLRSDEGCASTSGRDADASAAAPPPAVSHLPPAPPPAPPKRKLPAWAAELPSQPVPEPALASAQATFNSTQACAQGQPLGASSLHHPPSTAAAPAPPRATTSLAARLELQRLHGRAALHTAAMAASEQQADVAASAAVAELPAGAAGAVSQAQPQQQAEPSGAAGLRHNQAAHHGRTLPACLQAPATAAAQAAAAPPRRARVTAAAGELWDSDGMEGAHGDEDDVDDARAHAAQPAASEEVSDGSAGAAARGANELRQHPQPQQRVQLTMQRQQQQLAQLGVLGAAAPEDRWLLGALAAGDEPGGGSAGSRGGARASAGGARRGSRQAAGAAGAAAAGSEGGSRRRGAGASGGGARAPAAATQFTGAAAPALVLAADGHALLLHDPVTGLRLRVPGTINRHLRPYQREGVQFLFGRYAAGKGGVLCDDMGLGKTIQAIAFIAALLGKQGTTEDALPRSFAAFRRQQLLSRQPQSARRRRQRQQQRDHDDGSAGSSDEDEGEDEGGGGDSGSDERGGGGAAAASCIRWPVLVVCPTSVIDNWMRELDMWGAFKVMKFHGPPAVREALVEDASSGQYEVIVTSYDVVRVDGDSLAALRPHAVVFDEVQKMKNDRSKQYEAAALLPTKARFGLSGTIMQNTYEELFVVLNLLSPGCLGMYGAFVEYYSKPIKRGQSSTASGYEVAKADERRRQLVAVVRRVALRRTKAIIAHQLPSKTDNVVFCQLKPLQYRAYDRTLMSSDLQALRRAKEPCDCGSGQGRAACCHSMVPKRDGGVLWPHYHMCDCCAPACKRHRPRGCEEYYREQGYSHCRMRCPYCLIMPAIALLSRISNHLELIRPDPRLREVDEAQFEYELDVARLVLGSDADVLGGLMANSTGWLGASDETHCGKMATLKMLLRTWSADFVARNKVLLFSHSCRCLDLLEAFVQREGYDYVRLDGTTPQKHRQGLCDEFNSRPSIFLFLMSTVAGGLGLNLTAANKVVVFDPSWNPAHDLQAQDRAYRLGQTRDVAVYRLVGTGTLEEAVYKRQIYKQQQSNMIIDDVEEARYWEGVQGDSAKKGELWGLWNLLRFSGQTVETRDILAAHRSSQRAHIEAQLQQDAAHHARQQAAEDQLLSARQQQQQQQQQGRQQRAAAAAAAPDAAAAAAAGPSSRAAGAGAGGDGSGGDAKPFRIVVVDQLVGDDADVGALRSPAAAAAAGAGADLDIDPALYDDLVDEGVVVPAAAAAAASKHRQRRAAGTQRSASAAAAGATSQGGTGDDSGSGSSGAQEVGQGEHDSGSSRPRKRQRGGSIITIEERQEGGDAAAAGDMEPGDELLLQQQQQQQEQAGGDVAGAGMQPAKRRRQQVLSDDEEEEQGIMRGVLSAAAPAPGVLAPPAGGMEQECLPISISSTSASSSDDGNDVGSSGMAAGHSGDDEQQHLSQRQPLRPSQQAQTRPTAAAGTTGPPPPEFMADPVLAVLHQQGTVLHVHRHDAVLGRGGSTPQQRQAQRVGAAAAAGAATDGAAAHAAGLPGHCHGGSRAPSAAAAGARASGAGEPAPSTQAVAAAPPAAAPPTAAANALQRRGYLLRRSLQDALAACAPDVAASAEAAVAGGSPLLARLAVWQGVPVADVAAWFLGATAEERQELLSMYGADRSTAAAAALAV